MSASSLILKAMGVEQWRLRHTSPVKLYWVVVADTQYSELMQAILYYLQWPAEQTQILAPDKLEKALAKSSPQFLLSFGRWVMSGEYKSLDKITRIVETVDLAAMVVQPELKQRVLYDLGPFAL